MKTLSKLQANHFLLWDIMQVAEAKYQKILTSFDPQYEAIGDLPDNGSEVDAAIEKVIKEEREAGKPEAYEAFVSSYNAMLDNAIKFLEMEYPEKWIHASPLFSDPSNRIIYRTRILKIFANLGK